MSEEIPKNRIIYQKSLQSPSDFSVLTIRIQPKSVEPSTSGVPKPMKGFTRFRISDKGINDFSMKIPASLKYDFESNIGKIPLREVIYCNMHNMFYSDWNDKKVLVWMSLNFGLGPEKK